MAVFKCKICGGTLEINHGETVATCEYCGTKQTLPRLDDERKANLFDRANHFRRNNDFDKAMGIYEQILNEDTEDAESYWSIVLCRYGIEYVEDPSTRKRVPTVNRAQFTSVFDDEDYKSAIKYADDYQKSIYEAEAAAINEIQKGILAISQKEEPFDVFICYKETDNNGRRTQDSVLATELYHELTKEGFKVFFSRITLEDKLGIAYEPYIFAALHSAKVMVALGTKPEHFNAVWVKNEWARYLSIIKNGANKILIPAYRDMDPYDLPEEFSHLQAQDMSKLGFMQDLVRGIKKIISVDAPSGVKETVVVQSASPGNASALVKRGFLALEDSEWAKADEFFEQALNQNAEDSEAYLGKLMAECKAKTKEALKNCAQPFDNNNNYRKITRFADEKLKAELAGYIEDINVRNENNRLKGIYDKAVLRMNTATTEDGFKDAAATFNTISHYKDSKELSGRCLEKAETVRKDKILSDGKLRMKSDDISDYESAIKLFESISGWKDADEQIEVCRKRIEEIKINNQIAKEKREIIAKRNKKIAIIATFIVCVAIAVIVFFDNVIIPSINYNKAVALMEKEEYREATGLFMKADGYKDSEEYLEYLMEVSGAREILSAGGYHTVGLKSDGTVVAVGENSKGRCNVFDWEDIVAVSAGSYHTVGLKSDGTVVAVGYSKDGRCDVSDWEDIVAISAGASHTVGLKSDGTVVAVGHNQYGQCDVSDWEDIVAVSAGSYHTVGLKSDGTVVAVGYNKDGRCDVSDWEDIVAISASASHTVGLKSDGTVVAVGDNYDNECNVYDWEDIVAISAGTFYTVGLKSDGTVVSVGDDEMGKCDVYDWKDIKAPKLKK